MILAFDTLRNKEQVAKRVERPSPAQKTKFTHFNADLTWDQFRNRSASGVLTADLVQRRNPEAAETQRNTVLTLDQLVALTLVGSCQNAWTRWFK